MQLIGPGQAFPEHLRSSVLAIGNFDGVHRGHQTLFGVALEKAKRLGRPWGVVTFEPHPRTFFRPAEPVFRLTPLPLKARLAGALGSDFMVGLAFDAAFSGRSAEDFVEQVLVIRFGAAHVVTGYDFHFGKGRKGNPETMRRWGQTFGFTVTAVEQVTDDDGHAPFSSSAIRDALRHGRVREAARELGYWWTVMGEVVEGDRRGRTIGFPTLNLALEAGAEPFQGIYAVRVRAADTPGIVWPGAGYFGRRPTFETERTFLEVYLLDFAGDLYGRTLMVEFIDLIRPDRKFDSIADLTRQMTADCEEARRRLTVIERDDPIASFPLGRLQREGKI